MIGNHDKCWEKEEEEEEDSEQSDAKMPAIPSFKRQRTEYLPVDDNFADIDPLACPPELVSVDFTTRMSWDKFAPYSDSPMPLVAENEAPVYTDASPALCFHVHATSKRARATTLHLLPQPGQMQKSNPIPTPMFMPVGTKGCLKGVALQELTSDPALACPIILANTYHLAIQPGTELVATLNGLHAFQGVDKVTTPHPYNLLTDSGGFQMVSLVKLSQVSEAGVSFENPFQSSSSESSSDKGILLLRPEDSIRHQNEIGANIIMALDDVVSSISDDRPRFVTATYRTLRWYDRCYQAHAKKETQNLFPIVQGGLDTELGGLRERCLAGFRHRQQTLGYQVPGYAIGGLAGGESKDAFWRVVDQCCRALPDNKPRYLMGVGYPLDIVVCTALGVDLYDCVYPTRTARFGVCLVPGPSPGTLRLKSHQFGLDDRIIQEGCQCQACRLGVKRSRLHTLIKASNPVALQLVTQHNIAHMMQLVRSMRESILRNQFDLFVKGFVREQFPGKGPNDSPPGWVLEALAAADIQIA